MTIQLGSQESLMSHGHLCIVQQGPRLVTQLVSDKQFECWPCSLSASFVPSPQNCYVLMSSYQLGVLRDAILSTDFSEVRFSAVVYNANQFCIHLALLTLALLHCH